MSAPVTPEPLVIDFTKFKKYLGTLSPIMLIIFSHFYHGSCLTTLENRVVSLENSPTLEKSVIETFDDAKALFQAKKPQKSAQSTVKGAAHRSPPKGANGASR